MLVAAAEAIADVVAPDQLNASYIVPSVFDEKVAPAVARAIVAAAHPGRRSAGGAKESAASGAATWSARGGAARERGNAVTGPADRPTPQLTHVDRPVRPGWST